MNADQLLASDLRAATHQIDATGRLSVLPEVPLTLRQRRATEFTLQLMALGYAVAEEDQFRTIAKIAAYLAKELEKAEAKA